VSLATRIVKEERSFSYDLYGGSGLGWPSGPRTTAVAVNRARASIGAAATKMWSPSAVVYLPLRVTGRKSALRARPNPLMRTSRRSRRDVEAVDFSGIVDLRCGQVVGVFTVVVLDAHVAARQQLRQVCEIELVTLKPGLVVTPGDDT
jgi:hypothetical protein